ncbi:hypothetical protein HDU76_007066 [Blyttiomyces sp. JEL0837]|nr:hypothetical protein HDU76_007066 [Blyttiomyces sp. JEL0837]
MGNGVSRPQEPRTYRARPEVEHQHYQTSDQNNKDEITRAQAQSHHEPFQESPSSPTSPGPDEYSTADDHDAILSSTSAGDGQSPSWRIEAEARKVKPTTAEPRVEEPVFDKSKFVKANRELDSEAPKDTSIPFDSTNNAAVISPSPGPKFEFLEDEDLALMDDILNESHG